MCFILLWFVSSIVRAEFFPQDYDQSRQVFKDLCAQFKGQCGSYQIESSKDQNLFIDYGKWLKNSNKLIVMISGNHGPETYVGAMAQQLFIKNHLKKFQESGVDIVLIHALNPYGFKYNRRTDEQNVNLNRNFIYANSSTDVNEFKNDGYEKLQTTFSPRERVGNFFANNVRNHFKFIWALIISKFDKKYVSMAMNSGQYSDEKGINFGGKALRPQGSFLKDMLAPLFPKYNQVLIFDFHSGLGDKGTLHVMTSAKPIQKSLERVKKTIQEMATPLIHLTDDQDPGFYPTKGDLNDFMVYISNNHSDFLSLTLEFGTKGTDTLSQLDSASRMILENQAYFHGCDSEEACRLINQRFIDLFNPADDEWRKMVTDTSNKFFEKLLKQQ